jgi:hypothetical protein
LNEQGFIIYRDGIEVRRVGVDEQFSDDFDANRAGSEYAVSAVPGLSGFDRARRLTASARQNISGTIRSRTGRRRGVSVCLDRRRRGAALRRHRRPVVG